MKTTFNLKISDYINSPEGKTYFNQEHFTEASSHYDLATILMSLGQDKNWKHELIMDLPDYESPSVLDLATGTGDLVLEVAKRYPDARITGVDLTQAMLDIAKKRCAGLNAEFRICSIDCLNFPEKSFKLITAGYALRNSPNLQKTLSQIYSCLSDDGIVAILDFAKPESKLFQKLQYYLLKFWGSMWGIVLHANPQVHGYISASLHNYPAESALDAMIKQAGFNKIIRKRRFAGMMDLIFLQK